MAHSKAKSVLHSTAEVEYCAMAETACEMVWLCSLLDDEGVTPQTPIPMYCDNHAPVFIILWPNNTPPIE